MTNEEIIGRFRTWYGEQEGMKVYLTVMPGIMADFDRMLGNRPGELISEEYKLEDGKGSLILTGMKKPDGTVQVDTQCR